MAGKLFSPPEVSSAVLPSKAASAFHFSELLRDCSLQNRHPKHRHYCHLALHRDEPIRVVFESGTMLPELQRKALWESWRTRRGKRRSATVYCSTRRATAIRPHGIVGRRVAERRGRCRSAGIGRSQCVDPLAISCDRLHVIFQLRFWWVNGTGMEDCVRGSQNAHGPRKMDNVGYHIRTVI